MADCELKLELDQDGPHVAGGPLTGRLVVHARSAVRFDSSKVTLAYATSGRGTVDKGGDLVSLAEPMELAPGATASIPFEFVVPAEPITMRGTTLAVTWFLRGEVAVPWAFDPTVEREVVVVPPPREPMAGTGYRDPPHRRDGGHDVARPELSSMPMGAAVLVGLFGLFGVFMILNWRSRNPANGNFHLVQLAIVLVFVFATIWKLVGRRVLNHLAERGLGTPRIEVGPSTVPRGEAFDVAVTLAPASQLVLARVDATLRCTERASTGSGKNRSTRSHVAHQETVAIAQDVSVAAGASRTFAAKLRVPTSALPSLYLANNDVVWRVDVVIGPKGGVDHLTECPVDVAP